MFKSEITLFEFKDMSIEAVIDNNEQAWFVAKNIADFLEYSETRWAVKILDNDEKESVYLNRDGQKRKTWMINESGVYHLILKSTKPEAKSFRKWVTRDVLPSLRKTGMYSKDQVYLKLHQLDEARNKMRKKKAEIEDMEVDLRILKADYKELKKEYEEIADSNPNQLRLDI